MKKNDELKNTDPLTESCTCLDKIFTLPQAAAAKSVVGGAARRSALHIPGINNGLVELSRRHSPDNRSGLIFPGARQVLSARGTAVWVR